MSISVVIPTHNRPLLLNKCLNSLNHQLKYFDKITVIDDGSSFKNSLKNIEICKREKVAYIATKKSLGPAHARNIGINNSYSQWIVFFDDDVEVDYNFGQSISDLIKHVNSDVIGFEGSVITTGTGVWDSEVQNINGGSFLTANIIYRKSVFEQNNLFDERFTQPSGEDQEFAVRALKKGKILFKENLRVYHSLRSINLFSYLIQSPLRIYSLLDTELYFYIKHKDRYHTIRYANSFWGTFYFIATRHLLISLRRRNFKVLFFHPIQTFFLIISTMLEQFVSWFLVPFFFFRFYIFEQQFNIPAIDLNKTKSIFKYDNSISLKDYSLKRSFIKSISFRYTHYPVYNLCNFSNRSCNTKLCNKTSIFLRIDDIFLNQDKDIENFIEIIKIKKISFLAGITGSDLIDKSKRYLLKKMTDAGGVIALHGFSHTGKFGQFPSEILQMSFPQIDNMINLVDTNLKNTNYKPIGFIPPYNAVSWDQIVYLSTRFSIICGGPETMRFSNRIAVPVVLENGTIYFPSLYPFYQNSRNILKINMDKVISNFNIPICITLHLPVEVKENLKFTRRLLDKIAPYISDWKTLLSHKSML